MTIFSFIFFIISFPFFGRLRAVDSLPARKKKSLFKNLLLLAVDGAAAILHARKQ